MSNAAGRGDASRRPTTGAAAGQYARLWRRLDTVGVDLALVEERQGLTASGTMVAASPLPYAGRYRLRTDERWACMSLEVETYGAGWSRRVTLRRDGSGWRVTTHETGDLDAALAVAGRAIAPLPGIEDPDRLTGALDARVGQAPLFVTPPLRRLASTAGAGPVAATVVLVVLPSLAVLPELASYQLVDAGALRVRWDGFEAKLAVDAAGFVRDYPGVAELVQ